MISNLKIEKYMEFELTGIFQVKLASKNIVTQVPGELTPSCFCSVMSFSEKTYRLSEPDCCTLVFFLLNSILVYYFDLCLRKVILFS